LIVTGSDELTVPEASQVDGATRPPPVAEPLHWVIVAPVVVAGKGVQGSGFPGSGGPNGLPGGPPEPTHWLTVAAVAAPGPFTAMLLVIDTLHVNVPPPPRPELLHCVTEVTRSLEVVGVPPFSVTTEPVVPGLLVKLLMITTSHVVVSPGVSLMPLHWVTGTFAADAGPEDERTSPTPPPPNASATMPAAANLSEWCLSNVPANIMRHYTSFS
jgi:hypothetical protein